MPFSNSFWKVPSTAPQPSELAQAWSQVIVNGFNLLQASVDRSLNGQQPLPYDPSAPLRAFAEFAQHLWMDPPKILAAQHRLVQDVLALGAHAYRRLAGDDGAAPVITPQRGDRRFSAVEWTDEPVFDYLKQAYLLTVERTMALVDSVDPADATLKTRVAFYAQQFLHALSPANFVFTNPEALRRAVETGSISLLSGLANLLADAASPTGMVQRRSADNFEIGHDIAATPGSIVFQNEMMQLIQYTPTTKTVYRRPILYIPPLVNKYYFLDLSPNASLLRWLVSQGHTVFTISWVNPDKELADKGIADYVHSGILAALDAIEAATGEQTVDTFAFCMGGTLLAMTLALLAATGQEHRIGSATTIGSLVDFRRLGQWATFIESSQLAALEKYVQTSGVLSGTKLQALFGVVRANDLIWPSVVSHYLLDREQPASDILFWFADGAQIPAAFLVEYCRNLLVENALVRPGGMTLNGVPLDLTDVKTRLFSISLKDDHVSAWEATYDGARLFGGDVTFLLGGSGHNAGVINPPSAKKHGFWANSELPSSAQQWFDGAEKHEGSWWPTWQSWLARDGDSDKVPARVPGDGELSVLEAAPGSYVRVRH